MRYWIGFAFAVMLMATTAWADTDYRCLSACMRDGRTAPVCMPQCSYNLPDPALAKPQMPAGTLSNNAQFDAPIPISQVLLERPHVTPPPPSKDYACIYQCQRDGLQYQLCDQRCIKKETTIYSSALERMKGAATQTQPSPSAIQPLQKAPRIR